MWYNISEPALNIPCVHAFLTSVLWGGVISDKFHCQLEYSDLLKNWYLITYFRTGIFISYTSEILLPWSCCFLRYPILAWGFLSCRLRLLFIVAIFHQSFYVFCIIIVFLDSRSPSFTPNSFFLYISPNTNICWSELNLPLWLSTQRSDP